MVAFTEAKYISGFKSGADLSALTDKTKYIALQLEADGDTNTADANEKDFIGFMQNAPGLNKHVEVAGSGGGSKAIAAGTITAGDLCKTDSSGHLLTIGTHENAYAVCVALDDAVDNDVFQVFVLPPRYLVTGASGTQPVWARFTITLSEVNAGKALVPAVTGRKVYLHNFVAMPNGSFGSGTAIVLEDSTTGTDYISLAQAQLTDNNVLTLGETGVTISAAFGDGGASGEGLSLNATGSDFDTATDIAFNLLFSYV